jgi:hypothetical protein
LKKYISRLYRNYNVPEYGLMPPLIRRYTLHLLLLFLIVREGSCKKMEPDQTLSEKFNRAVIENTSGYISLDTVINGFEWDEMMVKTPYGSPSVFWKLQGRISNLSRLDLTENDYNDGLAYLIFINGNRAVAYCKMQETLCCDFSYEDWPNPTLVKKEDVFRIRKTMYKSNIGYSLEPKPLFQPTTK